MGNERFFDESSEQSEVKALIVAKYFAAWAKVIISEARKSNSNIAYVDLFAGPGRYKDGSKSTPLLVLSTAIADEYMREHLVAIFNDKDTDNSSALRDAIDGLEGIRKLKIMPEVRNEEVGTEIAAMFERMRLVPTLFFVDPWGYKGLSLRLINSVLKDWGCDCIVFFNYNRISMGLNNPAVLEHLVALFGVDRAEKLRGLVEGAAPSERELMIVNELASALQEMGGRYVLPFRFRSAAGTRTSHHLVFVSKHIRGYAIMKGIMASFSSSADQGVPSFEYNPATERFPLLFELTRPLDGLGDALLVRFAGRKLTMRAIYEQHNVGTPFVEKNYKEVLNRLEEEGRISVDPPAAKRPMRFGRRTFKDDAVVTFPRR